MSRRLAKFRRRKLINAMLALSVLIIVAPIFVNKIIKTTDAVALNGRCLAVDEATKNHLTTTYPEVYASTTEEDRIEVVVVPSADVANSTIYDNMMVCFPSHEPDYVMSVRELKYLGGWPRTTKSFNIIDDITGIDYAVYLRELYLYDSKLSKSGLAPIGNLANLEVLTLTGAAITEWEQLSSLPNFSNLRKLNLANNQLGGASMVPDLSNLTELWLKNNHITDLSFLSGLTSLDTLDLSQNNLAGIDVSPLTSLTNLKKLFLHGCGITNLPSLANLVNLEELNVGLNEITNLGFVSGLTNLRQLYLDNTRIVDLSVLSELTRLEGLAISNCHNHDGAINLNSMPAMVSLTFLMAESNQIRDLTPIASLINLTNLNLSDNEISDLTPIASLINLTNLNLSDNEISDLTPVASLTNLTRLNLSNNNITDISSVAGLNLRDIDLWYNQIENFSALAGMNLGEGWSGGAEQAVVKYIDSGASWDNNLKDHQGNFYRFKPDALHNLLYDQIRRQFTIVDVSKPAYLKYNCYEGSTAMKSRSRVEGCSTLVLYGSSVDFGLIHKTVNGVSHAEVINAEEFVYETKTTIPRQFSASPECFIEYGNDCDAEGLRSVRLVEEFDPRIIPLSSELYVGEKLFSDTAFSRYYKSIIKISDQAVEATLVPLFLLPTNDPDWLSWNDFYDLVHQNGDRNLLLSTLTEPLKLSLRTSSKLAAGVATDQTNIPSASQLYLGTINRNELATVSNLRFKKFGESSAMVSFRNGFGAPMSGSSGSGPSWIVYVGFTIAGLVFSRVSRLPRRHYK